jgi:hypothetical protein
VLADLEHVDSAQDSGHHSGRGTFIYLNRESPAGQLSVPLDGPVARGGNRLRLDVEVPKSKVERKIFYSALSDQCPAITRWQVDLYRNLAAMNRRHRGVPLNQVVRPSERGGALGGQNRH